MTATTTVSPYVIDVTDQTFATEVVETSKNVPVVVDFWAEWCGPCRMLGPVLERLAEEFNGAFILAKVDVDQNQQAAHQFQIQGIPAVKAFYNGNIVGEFTGAQPEPKIREFLQTLLPSQADAYVKQGFEWESSGQLTRAEANYRGALDENAKHYPALVGLGRILLKQNKTDEGLETLKQIPEGLPERVAAETLIATAEFLQAAAGANDVELRAAIEAEPTEASHHYTLACLFASEERYEEALEGFLNVIRLDRQYKDDAARRAMLALFTIMGDESELTRIYRRKLANALF